MCLAPLSDIFNCTGKGYNFSRSFTVVNHVVYMDDLKLYSCSQTKIELLVHTTIFPLMISVCALEQQSTVL